MPVTVEERESNDQLPWYCIEIADMLQFGIFLSKEKALLAVTPIDQMVAAAYEKTTKEVSGLLNRAKEHAEALIKKMKGRQEKSEDLPAGKVEVKVATINVEDLPAFLAKLMKEGGSK